MGETAGAAFRACSKFPRGGEKSIDTAAALHENLKRWEPVVRQSGFTADS